MNEVRKSLKNAVLRTMRSAGWYSLAARSKRRSESLLILCYHGISMRDEHEWAGHLFLTPSRFRERLACLQELKANVLPLAESLHRLKDGTLPPRSVAITFDDGFYDFLHHALPALQEFQYPATLYLTTYYSGLPFPIVNLGLNYILWKSGRKYVEFPEFGVADRMPTTDWDERAEVIHKTLLWCDATGRDTAGKDEVARSISAQLGIDYDDLLSSRIAQILNPDEVRSVVQSGIDIQLHTHRHRTPRDRELFLREIRDNADRISAITGAHPTHFCYPSGVYVDQFLPWLKECGVESATTCERGFARKDSEILLLPRLLDDNNMDLVQFEGFVAGAFG